MDYRVFRRFGGVLLTQAAGRTPRMSKFLSYSAFFLVYIRQVACALVVYSRREWAGARWPACISIIVAAEY